MWRQNTKVSGIYKQWSLEISVSCFFRRHLGLCGRGREATRGGRPVPRRKPESAKAVMEVVATTKTVWTLWLFMLSFWDSSFAVLLYCWKLFRRIKIAETGSRHTRCLVWYEFSNFFGEHFEEIHKLNPTVMGYLEQRFHHSPLWYGKRLASFGKTTAIIKSLFNRLIVCYLLVQEQIIKTNVIVGFLFLVNL